MSELLAERIAHRVRDNPSRIAVVSAREEISYADFWARVSRVASGLSSMNRVAVLPTSDVESLVVVTAAMRAGTSVVLLHRHLLEAQLERVLELTVPGAVVAESKQHRRLRRRGFSGELVTAVDLECDGASNQASADSELLVGVTSGTTGEPKLFVRNQLSWARTLDRSDAVFDVGVGDRVSVPGVLDHTHFLYGALHALTRGALVDLRGAETAVKAGATHLYSVPTIAWDLVRSGIEPVECVREVISSAARWPRSGRRALQATLPRASLVHFYGASELSFVSFDRGLGDIDEFSAGELFDGVDAEIRDGLVHVRSDMLFDGYLTEMGVVDGPLDGWMTVGDRGRVEVRRLQLLGRESDMLIRAGLKVEPAAVEAALTALPGIAEAACIGVPDARMGEAPAVAIVVNDDALQTEAIWRHLRTTLPSPSMPVRILRVDRLPRTPRGKLDRVALAIALSDSER
ncbi:AMP-binding protein [Rhodococcus sp. NPDC056743]|uniref:AMP-binding protein n=1 Tax=Rhodococcus sp. NPDC056743 TaxID=3345934 RepID=UPI00366B6D06